MYKIGIMGHSPEYFSLPEDKIRDLLRETIGLLVYQYKDVIFNIDADIGAGLWAADECLHSGGVFDGPVYYHLFLPYPLEITSEDWYDDQKELLKNCCNHAHSITICEAGKPASISSVYQPGCEIVQDSNFTIFYWNGMKQGHTFQAIKHALESNKVAINGLDDLKLITSQHLHK